MSLQANYSVQVRQSPPILEKDREGDPMQNSFRSSVMRPGADESALWLELLREECAIEPELTKWLEQESNELIATLRQ